ncbi:FapA family protein [Tissierella sp. MB52-C2]|uniref:DUF342 domain-containing protein n=1 Tax=Tissierella sp. MB52-C2 TaxID=3070999 RepID=UPI00280B0F87|nr:FapA family protein [Tissierella sp. MB52-C2]WMM26595.1 FapA family protein [Tissierella sp. MB52-C2]
MYNIHNNIILEISKDGLFGYITLKAGDSQEDTNLNYIEILNNIKEYIKYGLDEETLRRTLNSNIINEKTCIAEGTPPISGKDGSIKYHFDLEKPLLPKLNQDGTVNYKDLDALNTVEANDILAEIIPPREGVNGTKVNGEPIPYVRGKVPKFRYGKNVSVSFDGTFLKAESSGLVELSGGRVIVSPVLSIENIDSSTGHIDFNGNVIVNKDILNGFILKSTGSVEVKGALEGGYIESEGDILVRQGIQGYSRLTINTKGNISTKFIENSVINCGKNITAEAIMHSNVASKSNIIVLGKKGLIVGGSCKAKNEIRARIIGSSMATTTILEVGVDPDIKHRYDGLSEKLKSSKDNLEKINQSLKVLETLKRSNKLDGSKSQLYSDLVKGQLTLNMEIGKTERELNQIKDQMTNLSRGQIMVADTIYPGVKVIIGDSYMYIRDEMKRCRFYRENGEIRVGTY